MLAQLFKKTKEIRLERSYPSPIGAVWMAWTEAGALQEWWGPEKTIVPECEVDLRIGGTIRIVTVAGEGMGKYRGTRWPMQGTFTVIEAPHRLVYDARSWTEGEEEGTTIVHTNEITLAESAGTTTVTLHIRVSSIGPKAKMAAFGMKWGYKAQLDKLAAHLSGTT